MKKLLNTLYITTPDVYLSLDGENIVVLRDNEKLMRVPLHNLEGIVSFCYAGASPALMGACAERKIALSFFKPNGRFLADISGMEQGNVILRRTQYRISDNENESLGIVRNILIGKLHNCRWVLERATRDHAARIDTLRLNKATKSIKESISNLRQADNIATLRGIEGDAASVYFSVFDELILQSKEEFYFKIRSRRPPLDNVNALLSFAYSLLANETASAIRSTGLDPYVGFMHRDRPGRKSLALDLMEELRSVFADRFVLTLINTQQLKPSDFHKQDSEAVLLTDNGRRTFLNAWQNRKQEEIKHPFLQEKVEWGLVPYIQALLLARYLRGDLDEYPPFLWK